MSAKRTSGTTLDPALRFVAEAPPDADSPAAKPAGRRWELGSRQWRGFLFAIAALAFLVRLIPVLRGGGLTFYGRYDDGVYYAAADALTFGRVPYRDFVLLHPPVIMLAVAPFAALGRITSDQVGMATARVAFMAIGALNATLVARLARRWGLVAAVVAGIIYVGWLPAVFAEQTVLMEPIGGAAILVALLLLVKRPTLVTARAEWLAGGALGFAAVTKIWYLAPWALLVLWPLLQRRLGSALRILGGGVIVAAIIVAPFAVLARGRMWDMVIRDQLLRPAGTVPRLGRLADVAGASLIHHSPARWVLAIVVLVLIAACATLSAKDRSARLITALFVVDLLVLLASPSYFLHYTALTAASAALVVGIGVSLLHARHQWFGRGLVVVVTALAVVSAISVVGRRQELAFPHQAFSAAAPPGCVAADDPTALIEMDRLSSDLRAGCRVPVDVTGINYDRLHRVVDGQSVKRRFNLAWQHFIVRYLTSGTSFVIDRPWGDELNAVSRHELDQMPPIAAADNLVLRRVISKHP